MMRRGDICFADLEPVIGSASNKRRPVVIVSNDQVNAYVSIFGKGVVAAVPLTSNTSRILSFQVLLEADQTGLPRDSKAQAEQIRTLDVNRLGPTVGRVPLERMQQIDAAIRRHLQL